MKHQTPDSMKFKRLQRRLGVPRVAVVGTLELLWIATQKNAPQGDIGRHTNEEIAIECDWEGDPDHLVAALIETGWLDECDNHRLVVHNWEKHAPGWVTRQLKRHKKELVTPSSPPSVTRDGLEATNDTPTVTDDALEATPNLTQPNLTQPKKKRGKPRPESVDEVRAYCEEARELGRPGSFLRSLRIQRLEAGERQHDSGLASGGTDLGEAGFSEQVKSPQSPQIVA